MTGAWAGDWRARVELRLRELGYSRLVDFLRANPGCSYTEIASMLSATDDIAPVQIERLHADAAGAGDQPKQEAIADSFYRHVKEGLWRGWGRGNYWKSSLIGALASWGTMWEEEDWLEDVPRLLFDLDPPEGWVPTSMDDPILTRVLGAASHGR